jgi:FHA domain/Double zinc ribbon
MIVCPNCNHPNPDGAVQCEACYTPLPATTNCPSCGTTVQADAAFCGQCGFNLRAPATPSVAATIAPDIAVEVDPLVRPDPIPQAEPVVVTAPGKPPEPVPATVVAAPPPAAVEPVPATVVAAPPPAAVEPPPPPVLEEPAPAAVEPPPPPVLEEPEPAAVEPLPPPPVLEEPEPAAVEPPPPPVLEEPAPAAVEPPPPPPVLEEPEPTAVEAPPAPPPLAPLPITASRTQLQQITAGLVHLQSDTHIELPHNLSVIHIGKPNDRIPPDIDVSGFPNSEVVSRIHADIRVEGDACYIEDVGSSNGTYINNLPLLPGNRHRLRPGDRISLGKGDMVTFLFQLS